MSMEALEKVKQEITKAEDRIRYYEQQDKIMRSEIQRELKRIPSEPFRGNSYRAMYEAYTGTAHVSCCRP